MPATLTASDWTFVSGVIAVLETRLLTDDEYLDLLRLGDLHAALQQIRQVETYVDLPTPENPDESTAAVERQYVQNMFSLAKQLPAPDLAELTFVNYLFSGIRSRVRAQFEAEEKTRETPGHFESGDLDALWSDAKGEREHPDDVASRIASSLAGLDEPLREADLAVDRAELLYFARRAAEVDSEFVREWAWLYVRLRAALAIIRARLFGEKPETLRERFLAPPMDDGWLRDLASADEEKMPGVLSREFQPVTGDLPELSRATVGGLSRMMDDRLTEAMRPARRVAFGPERFFGYAWALHIENFNLRLITETLVVEGDRDHTRARLRMSYV